jgi:hypothetical protein
MNPVLALQLWIWSASSYNQKDQPVLYPGQTQFEYLHLGRYIWCYILAPMAAAVIAGLLVHIHDGVSPSAPEGKQAKKEELKENLVEERNDE